MEKQTKRLVKLSAILSAMVPIFTGTNPNAKEGQKPGIKPSKIDNLETSPVQRKLMEMELENPSLSNDEVIGAGYYKTGTDFMTNQPIYKQIPIVIEDCILGIGSPAMYTIYSVKGGKSINFNIGGSYHIDKDPSRGPSAAA